MKFTKEQIKEIESIDNINDLLKIFKRLIYLSDVSYVVLFSSMKSKFEDMLNDIYQ